MDGTSVQPASAVTTRLAKRASERFREIAVIKSRTNRFIWPAAVEGTKSRIVRFQTKDDLLKQVGTALVKDFPRPAENFCAFRPHSPKSAARRLPRAFSAWRAAGPGCRRSLAGN